MFLTSAVLAPCSLALWGPCCCILSSEAAHDFSLYSAINLLSSVIGSIHSLSHCSISVLKCLSALGLPFCLQSFPNRPCCLLAGVNLVLSSYLSLRTIWLLAEGSMVRAQAASLFPAASRPSMPCQAPYFPLSLVPSYLIPHYSDTLRSIPSNAASCRLGSRFFNP